MPATNDGIQASVEAIQNMEAACARFARVVVERLPEVERELRQVTDTLEDRRSNLRREISSLHDQISSADEDDDMSWERQRLEEAEDELASMQQRIRRLSEASANYAAQARRVENLATNHAVRTREFLTGAADDLKAYLAKNIDGMSGGVVTTAVALAAAGVVSSKTITDAEKQALRENVVQAQELLGEIDVLPGSYAHWQQIGDVKELPSLGDGKREGNPIFREALYHLASAQKRGLSSDEIVGELYKDSRLPKPIIEIRKERLIGNLKEIRLLGLDTPENLELLKAGKSPIVTKGNPRYFGEKAEVDHMVSVYQVPEFKNEVANFQLLPKSINREKRAASSDEQRAKLESAYKAAYQTELKSANEAANVQEK